jgi:hypothetical protein
MALPPVPVSGVEQNVNESIRQVGGDMPLDVKPAVREEIYKLDPATKVPVSKYEGNMWKGRRDAGRKAISHLIDGWEEAEYYYDNAQQNHRKETQGNRSGTRNVGKDRRDSYSMTENIVYATVNAVIPNVYAKNPSIEVTMTNKNMEKLGLALKRLGNRLAEMRSSPGINLKPKMRKCILRTEVTNEAWVLVGWTKREDSADAAREDITRIGEELAKAKDAKEIERLEGELLALEESIDLLDPPGPFVKTLRGVNVVVDPDSEEDDSSDANWIMICVMESTKYLNARFRQKDKDGNYASAYEASHVVDAVAANTNVQAVQEQVDTFKIFQSGKDDPSSYGYGDRNSYERAKRTAVWYCFDKVKRRFYMYTEKDWLWPIWVFDDPYHFPDFFPTERLQWHPSPTAPRTRGEVSHYLDQQDEINTIDDELNRARVSMRDKTIFNSRVISQKEVEDAMLNPNKKLVGIPIPEGHKLTDHIMGPPQPNMEHQHLWDKTSAKSAVNMISGLGEAMRGEQFKTNTTNQAIQEYSSISSTRLDEKRDAVEDFIGAIMWKVLFLCMQFMDQKSFQELTGGEFEDIPWQNMPPEQIRHTIQCRVEGGSTQKPTSAAKKAEALQLGQILGQFASASPVAILLAVKVFQRSFDGFTVTAEEWDMLMQSIQGALQQQQAEAGATDDENKEEAAVQEMVQKGMPEAEARKRVQDAKNNNGQVH